jgi:hypothetical protein
MVGPMSDYFIPVSPEGKPFLRSRKDKDRLPVAEDEEGTLWAIACPCKPRDKWDEEDNLPSRSAAAQGWQSIVPALLTINFMHTPQGERGYHNRVEHVPEGRYAKKFLQRNFRPLTRWYTLDIRPMLEAVREANGGANPRTMESFIKALHVVRGHYAHYPPNTYFGRKHEGWITVFRPAYRRGDVKAGVISKDYRIDTEVG